MKEGFLPLSRKLFEHPLWREQREFSCAEAWIDLLRLARFEANSTKILIKGKMVEVHRGEYPASLRHLAKLWGWSKNRVDNFINMLISEGMISKRTADGTNQTVITICKYGEYNFVSEVKGQEPGQSRDSDGTVTGQRRDNTNKYNNINNIITPPYNPPKGEDVREPIIKISEIKDFLLKDELWKENACRQSGLSVDFLPMIPAQIDNFLSWIQATGEEKSILTMPDVKRRFVYWWKYTGLKEWKDEKERISGKAIRTSSGGGSSNGTKPNYEEVF